MEPSASKAGGLPDFDLESVVRPLYEGFESLFEQVQLLSQQHATLERKLALAQTQVRTQQASSATFFTFHDEIFLALDLELLSWR